MQWGKRAPSNAPTVPQASIQTLLAKANALTVCPASTVRAARRRLIALRVTTALLAHRNLLFAQEVLCVFSHGVHSYQIACRALQATCVMKATQLLRSVRGATIAMGPLFPSAL